MLHDDLTILQVSPSDRGGGAEKVALDLHRAYLARGLDSWLALGARHGDIVNTLAIPNTASRSAWARFVLTAAGLADPAATSGLPRSLQRIARLTAEPARYRRVLAGFEDFDSPGTSGLLELPPHRPDVLHLHNLHGAYFDIRELPALASRVPTVLTMHDAWAITGHCAHPLDCPGYLSGCGSCPDLDRYVPIHADRSAENCRIKRDALRGGLVRIATPSQWLADMVTACGVADSLAELRVIPNGVDTSVFSPGDRLAARRELGLPAEAIVIAFAAQSARVNPYKGFDTLSAALPLIADGTAAREVRLLAIGAAEGDSDVGGVRVHNVPFVSDPGDLARYYRAADLYLHPARAESFGLTVLEAMACGTPVIASKVGGIPEVVVHDETGLLVPPDDPTALADATIALAADSARREALSCAGVARASRFTLERQVDAYLEWYAEMTDRR